MALFQPRGGGDDSWSCRHKIYGISKLHKLAQQLQKIFLGSAFGVGQNCMTQGTSDES